MILGSSQIQSRLRPSVLHSLLFCFQNLISLTAWQHWSPSCWFIGKASRQLKNVPGVLPKYVTDIEDATLTCTNFETSSLWEFSPCCFVCFLAFLAILGCDDTMLPSPAWIHQWTGCQSFLCVRFWLVLVLLFCFVCWLVLFCVSLLFAWFMLMTAQWTMYRSTPSSLLRPSTADGLEH